jgi:FixJ family two-component response regulator
LTSTVRPTTGAGVNTEGAQSSARERMVSGHSVTFIVASGNQDAVVAAARVAFSHLYVRLASELSGLDYQCELASRNIRIPVVFVTAHGDFPMCVRAMKAGAIEFLTKPFRDQDLLDAIRIAVERDRDSREQEEEVTELRRRVESLTRREHEVISMVVSGMLNKQIAAQLGTA